jgi:hypothetical protein
VGQIPVTGATVVRPRAPEPEQRPAPASRRDRIAYGLRVAGWRLPAVFVSGLAVSLAVGLGLGALGRAVLNVPSDFHQLKVPGIFPYAFPPIFGCTGGFIVAFIVKKPGRRSMHLFLTVGLKFALIDSLIAILGLPGSANAGSIVTLLAVILFPLLIMPALLRFVPRVGTPASEPAQVQIATAI